MQAKPMNIIPMIKGHHLPTLNSSISRSIRLHTNQVRVRVPENKTLTISKENNNEIDFKNYKSLFTSQRLETSKPVNLPLVDGSIPMDFPVGTYYLIGPGLFTDDHGSTVNPLDGHGYLRAFEINGANKEVKFSAQYVKTEAQKDEFDPKKGSWKFTHRGPFSVLKGGKVIGNTKVMKNVANTTVLKWGGRLFCLWEGGAPYEVQPGSLDTIGRFDLIDGDDFVQPGRACVKDVLDVVAALLKPVLHGSAMHLNQEENLYLVIAYISTSQVLCLNEKFMSLNPSKPILDLISTVGLILASCGLSPMISALSLNPSKSTSPLYLFPRGPCLTPSNTHGGLGWTVVEVPKQLWLLHIGNAFEEKDGNGNLHLQIDAVACSYKWFSFQNMFGYQWQSGSFDPSMMNTEDEENLLPRLVQVSIDLDDKGKCTNCSVEPPSTWTRPSDFPIINPKCQGARHQYIYAATSSGSHQAFPNFPFNTIVKSNTYNRIAQAWSTSEGVFIGEPMFVPKTMSVEEDDGYLLVVEYAVSQGKCYLVIIDAKQIGKSSALVSRFAVPKYLTFPLGFHGVWDPQILHVQQSKS